MDYDTVTKDGLLPLERVDDSQLTSALLLLEAASPSHCLNNSLSSLDSKIVSNYIILYLNCFLA